MLCEGVGRGMMDSLVYCNAPNFSSIGGPRTRAIAWLGSGNSCSWERSLYAMMPAHESVSLEASNIGVKSAPEISSHMKCHSVCLLVCFNIYYLLGHSWFLKEYSMIIVFLIYFLWMTEWKLSIRWLYLFFNSDLDVVVVLAFSFCRNDCDTLSTTLWWRKRRRRSSPSGYFYYYYYYSKHDSVWKGWTIESKKRIWAFWSRNVTGHSCNCLGVLCTGRSRTCSTSS